MKKHLTYWAITACILTLPLSAQALVNINIIEDGGNVTLSYSGTLDLTSLTRTGPFPGQDAHGIQIQNVPNTSGIINVFATNPSDVFFFSTPYSSTPADFMTIPPVGAFFDADSFSGDHFYILNRNTNSPLRLHGADFTGSTWSGTGSLTWNSSTFASLNLIPGTYTWTINNAMADTITLNVGAAAVPEPSTALPLLSLMVGIAWVRKRKK